METAARGIRGNAWANIRRYTGGSGRESSNSLDREDYHGDLFGFYNTLRNNWGLRLDYTKDSTLDSQLEETGLVSDRVTRHRYIFNPTWSRILTQRIRLDANYSYNQVDYSNNFQARLSDYKYQRVSTGLVYELSERDSLTLQAAYADFDPEFGADSETASLQAGYSREFNETLRASIFAGGRRTKTNGDETIPSGFCVGSNPGAQFPECPGGIPVVTGFNTNGISDTSTGSIFSADITKDWQTASITMSLSRQVTPTGFGDLIDKKRAKVVGRKRLSRLLTSSLSIEYFKTEGVNTESDVTSRRVDRELFRIIPHLRWRLTREWDLGASYEYTRQDRKNSENDAKRHAAYLTLTYRWPRISMSR